MKLRIMNAIAVVILALGAMGLLLSQTAAAQQKFETKPVVEKKLKDLPAEPLYWQVENYPTLGEAQAAAGPTSLVAEVAGKVWLFTLGPKGGPGGRRNQSGRDRAIDPCDCV
jgi:hypothetical protein